MSPAADRDGLEALESEIEEDLAAEADAPARTGRAVRNINWNVIYLGAGALLLVLLTVAFMQTSGDGRQAPRQTGSAGRDTRTPAPAEPPYREAARETRRAAADDTLASAPAVPPKSSAVVGGGAGDRDYREVRSGEPAAAGAPTTGDPAHGGEGGAAVQGGGQERPPDPRREAWAAARDEVPEPGWGTTRAGSAFQRLGESGAAGAPGEESGTGADTAAGDESALREAEAAFGLAPGRMAGGHGGTRPPVVPGGMVVPAMTVIPAMLVTGITSETGGDVIAQVTQDVRDRSGKQTAVPRGSRVSGRLARPPVPGDARVDISWNLLRFPDRSTVPLPGLGTADRTGAGGVPARVDTHYGPALLTAVVGSVLGGGFQLAQAWQGRQPAPGVGQGPAGAAGQQVARVGGDLVTRGGGIRSTATVAPATRILILVREDLLLPPRVP
jgi:type IV secretion system protein VirB10